MLADFVMVISSSSEVFFMNVVIYHAQKSILGKEFWKTPVLITHETGCDLGASGFFTLSLLAAALHYSVSIESKHRLRLWFVPMGLGLSVSIWGEHKIKVVFMHACIQLGGMETWLAINTPLICNLHSYDINLDSGVIKFGHEEQDFLKHDRRRSSRWCCPFAGTHWKRHSFRAAHCRQHLHLHCWSRRVGLALCIQDQWMGCCCDHCHFGGFPHILLHAAAGQFSFFPPISLSMNLYHELK